jgi:hypothetical protein
MGTALNTNTGSSGPPSVKPDTPGAAVKFAVIDCNPDVPVTEYGTGQPVLNRRGEQKKQIVLTVLVLGHDGDSDPAEVGSVRSIWASSYAKYDPDRDAQGGTHVSLGGALDLLDGGLQVGDVGEWKYLQNLPSQGAEPRKDRKFRLRHPKPEEGEQTAQCERLRAELAGNVLVAQGAGPFDGDDDSF